MKSGTIREVSRSLLCGIFLLLAVFGVRKIFPENQIVILFICTILTVIIYGVAFRNYYSRLTTLK